MCSSLVVSRAEAGLSSYRTRALVVVDAVRAVVRNAAVGMMDQNATRGLEAKRWIHDAPTPRFLLSWITVSN